MKLAHRLLLQSLAIIAVLVVSVVIIIDYQLHSRITEQTIHDLSGEARLLATNGDPTFDPDSLANQAGVATGHRITLIDSTGHVIGDSEFDGPALDRLENHSRRPEVIAARDSGVGSARRMSPSTGEEQLYVALKVPQGIARVSVTTRTVEDLFDSARRESSPPVLSPFCWQQFSPSFFHAPFRDPLSTSGTWRARSQRESGACTLPWPRPARWETLPMPFTAC